MGRPIDREWAQIESIEKELSPSSAVCPNHSSAGGFRLKVYPEAASVLAASWGPYTAMANHVGGQAPQVAALPRRRTAPGSTPPAVMAPPPRWLGGPE
jgi:hypothetical protein